MQRFDRRLDKLEQSYDVNQPPRPPAPHFCDGSEAGCERGGLHIVIERVGEAFTDEVQRHGKGA